MITVGLPGDFVAVKRAKKMRSSKLDRIKGEENLNSDRNERIQELFIV